jgi:hypothetical protein
MPCRHEVLIAEIVADSIYFYECKHCLQKFDHHLQPFVEPTITETFQTEP